MSEKRKLSKISMLLSSLLVIAIVAIIVICIIIFVNKSNIENNNEISFTKKIEDTYIKEDLFSFMEPTVAGVYGAKEGYRVQLSDYSIIEVYVFDKNTDIFKEIKQSNKMYVLNSTASYDVIVNNNITCLTVNTGKEYNKVIDMFKQIKF